MQEQSTRIRVEMFSLGVTAEGDAFIMELAAGSREAVRLEFPDWIVHQLMRALPHLDAAIQQRSPATKSLIAYPVAAWNIEPAGGGMGITVHLRTDRDVDAAFHLQPADALAIHQALAEAIERDAVLDPVPATFN